MLSRVPWPLLLAQLLPALEAQRQNVLFLPQHLAQPPPVLPSQSCWRRGATAARLFTCLLGKRHRGPQVLPTGEWRSTGVEWDRGQVLAKLSSPGSGAEGAGEVQGPPQAPPSLSLHPAPP